MAVAPGGAPPVATDNTIFPVTSPARPPAGPPAPGWHPDPVGGHESRYWNGTTWTDHVATDGRQGADPVTGQQDSTG